MRMRVNAALFAAAILFLSLGAQAAEWPTKPVEFVVPGNPGGDTDINCRIFAKYMEKELGQPMVVVNMAGAAGAIAMNNVRTAKADGHRAVFYHNGALIAHLMEFVDFSILDAFEMAGIPVIDKTNAFVSGGKAPYSNIRELVEYAKANPNKVSFGTETGSFTHLQVLALESAAGVKFNIADAGTAAEKVTALLGGRIDTTGLAYGTIKDYVKTGEFKCLGILSDQRIEGIEAGTFVENGVDVVMNKFFFVGFPKGTDKAIIEKFSAAAEKVAKNPGYLAECKVYFVNGTYYSPADTVKYIADQIKFYDKYKSALTGN